MDAHGAILSESDGLAKYINNKDGHHLTREGHRLYADLMVGQLRPRCPR
ncbi:MAG: hypothetical protein KKI08_09870 [Armatimonadetes bacterium]|nr:hypothetical protein [Armatimonadota bacterium]